MKIDSYSYHTIEILNKLVSQIKTVRKKLQLLKENYKHMLRIIQQKIQKAMKAFGP